MLQGISSTVQGSNSQQGTQETGGVRPQDEINSSEPTNNKASAQNEALAENYLEKYTPGKNSPKSLSDLGGMDDLKATLYDDIVVPILNNDLANLDMEEYGKATSRGILLYGPPGCGKTAIVEALSGESGIPLYKLKISNTGSIYINGSAINLQKAYDCVANIAKESGKPVMLFIDEADAFASKRSNSGGHSEDNKVVSTILQILDESKNDNVIVICATNKFDMLDDAFTSRLETQVYVGLPDTVTREKVLQVVLNRITKGQELANNPVELNKVANMTEGFSNRNLVMLTYAAAQIARLDGRRNITADDYVKPVKDNELLKVDETKYNPKRIRAHQIGFRR